MKKFAGTGVALVTPFDKQGQVDFKSLEKLVEHVITGGVEYLVPLGTTGESVTLTKEEKTEIVRVVISVNKNRVPVVLGLGGNNTSEIVAAINETSFYGIDGILSVSPYYNKPSQEGIFQHYKAIAVASPVPVILYNVPGRTSSNILPETTLRIANEIKNVVAVKEASGNIEQMMKIIKDKSNDFLVVSGDDTLTLPLIAAGGNGVISVVANIYPKEFSQMVRYALDGNFSEARKIHYKLFDFINLLFTEGNPSGIKAALHLAEICENNFRLPLVPASKVLYERLSVEMKKILMQAN